MEEESYHVLMGVRGSEGEGEREREGDGEYEAKMHLCSLCFLLTLSPALFFLPISHATCTHKHKYSLSGTQARTHTLSDNHTLTYSLTHTLTHTHTHTYAHTHTHTHIHTLSLSPFLTLPDLSSL